MSTRAVWLRRIAIALGLAAVLGTVPYDLYGRSGLARLVKLRGELSTLRSENRDLLRENSRLRAEVTLYDDDPLGAVERNARDELGMVRPGELVFQITGPSGHSEMASAFDSPPPPTSIRSRPDARSPGTEVR